ncbi:MAG TPA: hypothetical protein VJA21_08425 [Verrucomicrobiae bacterium]
MSDSLNNSTDGTRRGATRPGARPFVSLVGQACGLAFGLCGLILITNACRHQMPETPPNSQRPDINQVLERHQQELMALPNVVGVCVALMPDEKSLCLKVLLSRKDRATRSRLPKTLEGYPVVSEVTGEIRPM